MRSGSSLIGVQYLRGVAALLVVMDHCSGMLGSKKYYGSSPWGNVLAAGGVGVDLFFVISGFIIFYVALAPDAFAPRMRVSDYFKRRFARIIPFLWVCVVSYGVLKFLGRGGFPLQPYFRALFLVPGGEVQPNAVWTLRHEMLFYVVFSFALLNVGWRFIPLILWVLSPIFVLPVLGYAGRGSVESLWYFFVNPLNLLFGMGVLVAVAYVKGWIPRFFKGVSFLFVIPCSLALVGFASVVGYERSNLIQIPFVALACGAILILGVMGGSNSGTGIIDRILGLMGDASYAIYLSHEAFLSAVLGVFSKFKSALPIEFAFCFALLFSVLMGVVTHKYVEKPLVEWFNPRRIR